MALKKIVDMSPSPADEAIGVLTSENRDNWAKAYQLLIKGNKKKQIYYHLCPIGIYLNSYMILFCISF